jgi:ribosomal protein S6--L-glutamate ligase
MAMTEVGWREWAALPGLGLPRIRAKLDTGARSSALHVDRQWRFAEAGAPWVGFSLVPGKRRGPVEVFAPVVDEREVTDSGGHRTLRVFLRTRLELAGIESRNRHQPGGSLRHALPDAARAHRAGRNVRGGSVGFVHPPAQAAWNHCRPRRPWLKPSMKLAILSRNSKLYSTRRLVEAARAQGHSVRVLDPLRCYMRIGSDGFEMRYKGAPISGYAAVVPRIGASVTRYGCAVLRQFELMGSYTPNSAAAIARARDKLRCHQVLAAKGIGLPVTVFGDNPDDTGDLLAMLGPPPHVVKLNEGTQGNGVMLTEKLSASRGAIETLRGLYANFIVQEFIAEAKGADLRCFVVGDRVVAAMRRQAPKGDFRSNLHRGGTAKAVRLRPRRKCRPRCARRRSSASAWPAWT